MSNSFTNIYTNWISPLSESKKVFLLYFFLIQIVYFVTYFQYFQQDEWFALSYFHQFPFTFQGAWGAFIVAFTDPKPYALHLTPFATLLWWLQSKLFGITFPLYAFLSLTLHAIVSFLVYEFTKRLTKNPFVSLIAGLFFALTASHSQAVTWMSALPAEVTCLFVLLSLNSFLDFLQSHKRKKYLLSILFFLFAVLTKETGVLLIFLLPLLALFYSVKDRNHSKLGFIRILIRLKLFFIASASYLALRIIIPPLIVAMTHTKAIEGIAVKNNNVFFSLYYTGTFFLKALSESFFSLPLLNSLSAIITDFGYPQYTAQKEVRGAEYLTFIQSAGLDIAMYLTGFLILLLFVVIFFVFIKDQRYKKALLISFFMIFFSILPITFLAGWLLSMFSYFSTIESRHLYITSIGVSIFVGFGLYFLYMKTKELKLFRVSFRYLFVVILVLWTLGQMITIFFDPSTDLQTAADRRNIVNLWLEERPILGKKTIFYSDSNVALYGFGEYMLPFQNTPAQVLVGIYGMRQSLPEAFFKKEFLYKKLTEEWYQEYNGIGIGYYVNKKHLLQAVVDHNIAPEDVVMLTYDGQGHFVENTSYLFRYDIKKFLDKKKALKNWKKYENKIIHYRLLYPQEYTLYELPMRTASGISYIAIKDSNLSVPILEIAVYKKGESEGVSNFVSGLDNGSGEAIGNNYTFENIAIGSTDKYTMVVVKSDTQTRYFFNTVTNKEVKEIAIPQESLLSFQQKGILEDMLAQIEFTN
jgi:hypothetical protein